MTSAGATVQPLEPAQLVWRRAVTLSTAEPDGERFGLVLDLLRTAQHGPSTMLHALALGREQQRIAPGDLRIRDAIRLLTRTTEWLGTRAEDNEVGAARRASAVRRGRRR